eukprot:Hpha_TRINITY_DN26877_c0_g1::TRINITY_DN26877_c0_g1_i1::g.17334::m.17334
MLRRTCRILGMGGEGKAPRGTAGHKGGGSSHSHLTRHARIAKYGPYSSTPHRAGTPMGSLWRTRTTMANHQFDFPDWHKLSFVQNIELPAERSQLTYQVKSLVPSRPREGYEQWKADNVEEIKRYAGRYVIGHGALSAEDPTDLSKGTYSIVRVFEPHEEAAIASVVRDMDAKNSEPLLDTWLDFIPVGFGEETVEFRRPPRPAVVMESDAIPRRQEDEERWWNSTDFDDVDDLKEWVDFDQKPSRPHVAQYTPVSSKLAPGKLVADAPLPPEPYPSVPKWLTFNAELSYGSENFSPTWAGRHNIWEMGSGRKYGGQWKPAMFEGFAREFLPDHNFQLENRGGKLHKKKSFVQDMLKRRIYLPTWTSPDSREIKVVTNSLFLAQTAKFRLGVSGTFKVNLLGNNIKSRKDGRKHFYHHSIMPSSVTQNRFGAVTRMGARTA